MMTPWWLMLWCAVLAAAMRGAVRERAIVVAPWRSCGPGYKRDRHGRCRHEFRMESSNVRCDENVEENIVFWQA